jgi:hypothetical protein
MKADFYAVSGTSPTSLQEPSYDAHSSATPVFPQSPTADSNFAFLGVGPSGSETTFKTTSLIIGSVCFLWIQVPEDGVA